MLINIIIIIIIIIIITAKTKTKTAQKWSQGASGPRSRAENYNTGCNLYTDQPNGGSQQL